MIVGFIYSATEAVVTAMRLHMQVRQYGCQSTVVRD